MKLWEYCIILYFFPSCESPTKWRKNAQTKDEGLLLMLIIVEIMVVEIILVEIMVSLVDIMVLVERLWNGFTT